MNVYRFSDKAALASALMAGEVVVINYMCSNSESTKIRVIRLLDANIISGLVGLQKCWFVYDKCYMVFDWDTVRAWDIVQLTPKYPTDNYSNTFESQTEYREPYHQDDKPND